MNGVGDHPGEPGHGAAERRVGTRLPAQGVQVDWVVEERSRLGRTKLNAVDAAMVEVSVTGAMLIAPRSRFVEVGTQAVVGLGDGRAVVSVRHIAPGPDDDHLGYGVHFVEPDETFQNEVFDLVAKHRGSEIVWRWDQAR
jgi:hypothetical protein